MKKGSRFKLELELGNEAMFTNSDVATALREAAERVEQGNAFGKIRDRNGNTVGTFTFTGGNR